MRKVDHWIAGKSVEPKSGEYLLTTDPRTGQPVAETALGGAVEVSQAVEAARIAQPSWAALSPAKRGRMLDDLGHALRAHGDEISEMESAETGRLAATIEVGGTADYFEYYGGIVRAFFGETIGLGSSQHAYTVHEPFGIVGIITPWNSPINQAARGIAPALAVGNAVVVKPSEYTSSTTVLLAQIASEIGFPEGLLNVVTGTGTGVGVPLVQHEGIRKVAFTGSVATGRAIAGMAASRLIPVTLELGGKSPNLVFADADLEAAAQGAARFTRNVGQVCSAPTRLLVQESIAKDFVQKVVGIVRKVTPGDRLAPLTTEAQFQKVLSYFDIAEADGAKLLVGGSAANVGPLKDGWFVEPTMYGSVTPSMRVFQEEIFGPVLTVTTFTDEEDAIRLANATDYGLCAYIWTESASHAHRVASQIDAGQILINGGQFSNESPFGGFKNSGLGREKGFESLRNYTQLKTVVLATGK